MPTPLGHTLAGLAIFAIVRDRTGAKVKAQRETFGWLALCVVASSVPDLDFIIWGDKGFELTARYHHGLTHSIGFAIAFGLVVAVWAWARKFPNPTKVFVITSVSIWLHAVMDFLGTDGYPINGIGLPLLWPISDQYFILPLMPGVNRANPWELATLFALGMELILYGSMLFIAIEIGKAWRRPSKHS